MDDSRERIKVWIKYEKGQTVCICSRANKKCDSDTCLKEKVFRNRYEGLKECFRQDRYGKSRI